MSTPSVEQAVTLLINGEIHGFLYPPTSSVAEAKASLAGILPYYARPSRYHMLDTVPLTANGKVDKKALRDLATESQTEHHTSLSAQEKAGMPGNDMSHTEYTSDSNELSKEKLETSITHISSNSRSLTMVSTTSSSPSIVDFKLERELPNKSFPKLLRNLVHRAFIPYRFLLVFVYLGNISALVYMYARGINREWCGNMVAINLLTAVLIRQEVVINALYTIFCSVPKSWPLWIRASCAKIYHLGGVHSSAATWSAFWLLASNITDAVCTSTSSGAAACVNYPYHSIAYQFLSWMLTALFASMLVFALPPIRTKHHDFFERWHRFIGWTMLGLFWVQTFIGVNDKAVEIFSSFGLVLTQTPAFWLLATATLSIASSWFWLRKVPVISEVLSNHAIRLHFSYTIPVNGSFTRLSFRPLLEWHSFATVPAPEPHGRCPDVGDGDVAQQFPAGYSLVVSNAGDWTRHCIENPPREIWVRGIPTCGVMRIATLFSRVLVVATGSGIGPLLGHIQRPTCATACLWSTRDPVKTFGHELVDQVKKQMGSDMVIWDTTTQGRPDMVRLAFNMATEFGAEAVIIIANRKITTKVVYGLETRGVNAYGAIWDS
jgi:hypothetical protein